MKKVSICLDVGGSFIKAATFSEDILDRHSDIKYYPTKSNQSKDLIVENFGMVFQDLLSEFIESDYYVDKIAIAFPGPFDYERGISEIKGLNKFDSLYNINLFDEFNRLFRTNEYCKLKNARIFFKNDAEAFAIGENKYGKRDKGAYFTIGTGLGSTFIEASRVVKGKYNIPESGMIYNQEFKGKIIDDYISARGLEKLIEKRYTESMKGSDLFEQASSGSSTAIKVFEEFGKMIGQAISPFVEQFQPDEIVLGGQISKSYQFFKRELMLSLNLDNREIIIRTSEDTTIRTLEGLFLLDGEEQ